LFHISPRPLGFWKRPYLNESQEHFQHLRRVGIDFLSRRSADPLTNP
jgi:hypothetical protein